jgi:(1->4)-alpha-D-glucan 1-alpha-D-glucosylmutase
VANSLAQVALKIASPGVPDFYQGSELWDLNLVDPDNRRPVDFDDRARRLNDVARILEQPAGDRRASLARLLRDSSDGTIKLFVTAAGLRLRSSEPRLFLDGDYLPLETETTVPARVIAFARQLAAADGAPARAAVVIAPHLAARVIDASHPVPVGDVWKTSRVMLPLALAGLTYRDAFTGATVVPARSADRGWFLVGQVLETLPVSLLIAD